MSAVDQAPVTDPEERGAPREPWRILLLITTSDFGGAESFLEGFVENLDRRRFSPVVCSLCPVGGAGRSIAATGVPVLSLEMSDHPRPTELIRGTVRLARLIDRLEIDLVQGQLYRANVIGALASRFARRRPRMVTAQHSLRALTRSGDLAARVTRSLSHRVVSVSEAVRNAMIQSGGVSPEHALLIPNGVDTSRYSPRERAPARELIGLPNETMVVGAVGRMTPVKGLRDLVDALASLVTAGLPAKLALIGDGPERSELERQTREIGLVEHVRFLGVRHDLDRVYPALDVFALPSLREGLPMALLEAMASGCAPVASRVGGVPEVIEEGRSGLLVPPGQLPELGKALARLARDDGLRRRLGRGARERIEEAFSLEAAVRRHEALYASLLTARPGVGG